MGVTVQDSTLDYPWAIPPDKPTPFPIAPGISWVRMPLPFELNHINLWILEDYDDDVVIVDTGISDSPTQHLWQQIAAARPTHQLKGRLLCTHFHPDHMGLAGWLCNHFPLTFVTPLEEWQAGDIIAHPASAERTEARMVFYKKAGLSNEHIEALKRANHGFMRFVTPPPTTFQTLQDMDDFVVGSQTWHVVCGRGHSPNTACLWNRDEEIFIASDQILPRISPNISVWPDHPDADPLREYCDSLCRIKSLLTGSTLVLPSHGLPFRGVHQRIDQILEHHVQRLNECFRACEKKSHSALDLVPVLFPRANDRNLLFAIGEAMAHAHALRTMGDLDEVTDSDGVVRYRACHQSRPVDPGQAFLCHSMGA